MSTDIHVRIPDRLAKELQLVATAEGVSIADLVADLISDPLNERVREVMNRLEIPDSKENKSAEL